jgi:histidinol-phosphate aminotransferase
LARRYPQTAGLQAELAERFGVGSDQVLVTAGGDDSLARICQAFVDPGSEVLLPTPTFEMIAKYALLAGGVLREVPWGLNDFPVDDILRSVSAQTRMVAVVSPNNPTGSVVRATELERLIRELPQVLLLVDLAYAEFAAEDLTSVALAASNTIVVRTFSKAWGLAGLRVGYALGTRPSIEALRRASSTERPLTG